MSERQNNNRPLSGRTAQVTGSDIANACLYFASGDAYVTGQLFLNGGDQMF